MCICKSVTVRRRVCHSCCWEVITGREMLSESSELHRLRVVIAAPKLCLCQWTGMSWIWNKGSCYCVRFTSACWNVLLKVKMCTHRHESQWRWGSSESSAQCSGISSSFMLSVCLNSSIIVNNWASDSLKQPEPENKKPLWWNYAHI